MAQVVRAKISIKVGAKRDPRRSFPCTLACRWGHRRLVTDVLLQLPRLQDASRGRRCANMAICDGAEGRSTYYPCIQRRGAADSTASSMQASHYSKRPAPTDESAA